MPIVTLARGSYTSSIVGEREEKRGQTHKAFLEVGKVLVVTVLAMLSPWPLIVEAFLKFRGWQRNEATPCSL
jgi:hypothetical protein